MRYFVVELDDDDVVQLERLIAEDTWDDFGSIDAVLYHLARHAADGVRRPGSWERGWLTQVTGWPRWVPDA
jgi:hypothetical protein